MKNQKISKFSKVLLVLAALCLIVSIFVPIWSISLDAPQYPEGLGLQIWANKLAGDVDIINGLNHYIGMKTLHSEDFIEFTVLPYIIAGFALLFIIAAITGKRKLLYFSLILFIAFGIISMVDFWKWEYDYGHDLDPDAAIKIPGMAYQPPLIGFKQLLNFGAYSIPDIGGWLFVVAGLLLVVAVVLEKRSVRSTTIKKSAIAPAIIAIILASCNSAGPEPIQYNKDACDFCKMSISDSRFAAELVTEKGRVYKFDDIACMISYNKANTTVPVKNFYIGHFLKDGQLMSTEGAFFVQHESVKSPMAGNVAAFDVKDDAYEFADKNHTKVISWQALMLNNAEEE